ncbi:type II secretion system protein N [Rhodoferax sp. GW822-FHT02A01]|uniref:type II secretion system protein N n=1 Tax=Rhodoferax sp. GW822-FHT02A01 TaxID=3141537 RepID=UPI00315D0729
MQVTTPNLWIPRLSAFALGLLLALSVGYWVLHWPSKELGRELPAPAAANDAVLAKPEEIARLLGAVAAPMGNTATVDAASRIRLTGIIASPGGQGVALLSIDGKPPKPYRVGSTLEEGLVLQSVESRRVALSGDAKGPVRMRLELPTRP